MGPIGNRRLRRAWPANAETQRFGFSEGTRSVKGSLAGDLCYGPWRDFLLGARNEAGAIDVLIKPGAVLGAVGVVYLVKIFAPEAKGTVGPLSTSAKCSGPCTDPGHEWREFD